jgi:tetratricopeptide (TPR) repeat protein
MSKRWQKVEVAYLKKHASDKSLGELAQRFHVDEGAVSAKLEELRGASTAVAEQQADEIDHYQQGLQALYAGDWAKAVALLDAVDPDSSPELVARARQFAAVARQRLAEAPPEDPWLLAVFERNQGRFDESLALCEAEGRATNDGRFAYLAAVLQTLRGDLEAGRRHLERAIELDPHNRAHALHDPDLRPLRAESGAE